jgi:hypothetical protein
MKEVQIFAIVLCLAVTVKSNSPLQALRSKLQASSEQAGKMSHMPLWLDNERELREAKAALFSADSQGGWLLINYVGTNLYDIHFAAQGQGSWDEVSAHFKDDKIQYGVIRFSNILETGATKLTNRDVFFTWIGPKVTEAQKAGNTKFNGDPQWYLGPFQTEITVLRKDCMLADVLELSSPLSASRVCK